MPDTGGAFAAEAIECEREPLGAVKTFMIWSVMAMAVLIAVFGVVARSPQCAYALLVPVLLYTVALMHVWRTRRYATIQLSLIHI